MKRLISFFLIFTLLISVAPVVYSNDLTIEDIQQQAKVQMNSYALAQTQEINTFVENQTTVVLPETNETTVWDGVSYNTNWKGQGTKENPYLIETANDLAGISHIYNNDSSYRDYYFLQTNDILLNNLAEKTNLWTPIGKNENYVFGGTYDGNGFSISGLYVEESQYAGLFGYTTRITVKNLHIKDAYISAQTTDVAAHAGGIVGYSNHYYNDIFSYCTFSGEVIARSALKNAYSGGIIGYRDGSLEITNCINYGNISSYTDGVYPYIEAAFEAYSAGIVGFINDNYAHIKNCGNNGEIYANSVSSYEICAGICGRVEANSSNNPPTFENCYNKGLISSHNGEAELYGIGNAWVLRGNTYSSFINCFNEGNFAIKGETPPSQYPQYVSITGIGTNPINCYNSSDINFTNTDISVNITGVGDYPVNCFNTGNVTLAQGGVFGVGAYAKNCFNTGNFTVLNGSACGIGSNDYESIINCYNAGNMYAEGGYAAGITLITAGNYRYSGYSGNEMEFVTNCYNAGDITGGSRAGGIAATSVYSEIANCYNLGSVKITDPYSTQKGGIVGYGYDKTAVRNCYNLGYVSTSSGCSIGVVDDVIAMCYQTDPNIPEEYEKRLFAYSFEQFADGTVTSLLNEKKENCLGAECCEWVQGDFYPIFDWAGVRFNQTGITMVKGEKVTLKGAYTPEQIGDTVIEWSYSDDCIETNHPVYTPNDDGTYNIELEITAREKGSCIIIAKAQTGMAAICNITVEEGRIAFDKQRFYIEYGSDGYIGGTVIKSDEVSADMIQWEIDNPSILTLKSTNCIASPVSLKSPISATVSANTHGITQMKVSYFENEAICEVSVPTHKVTPSHKSGADVMPEVNEPLGVYADFEYPIKNVDLSKGGMKVISHSTGLPVYTLTAKDIEVDGTRITLKKDNLYKVLKDTERYRVEIANECIILDNNGTDVEYTYNDSYDYFADFTLYMPVIVSEVYPIETGSTAVYNSKVIRYYQLFNAETKEPMANTTVYCSVNLSVSNTITDNEGLFATEYSVNSQESHSAELKFKIKSGKYYKERTNADLPQPYWVEVSPRVINNYYEVYKSAKANIGVGAGGSVGRTKLELFDCSVTGGVASTFSMSFDDKYTHIDAWMEYKDGESTGSETAVGPNAQLWGDNMPGISATVSENGEIGQDLGFKTYMPDFYNYISNDEQRQKDNATKAMAALMYSVAGKNDVMAKTLSRVISEYSDFTDKVSSQTISINNNASVSGTVTNIGGVADVDFTIAGYGSNTVYKNETVTSSSGDRTIKYTTTASMSANVLNTTVSALKNLMPSGIDTGVPVLEGLFTTSLETKQEIVSTVDGIGNVTSFKIYRYLPKTTSSVMDFSFSDDNNTYIIEYDFAGDNLKNILTDNAIKDIATGKKPFIDNAVVNNIVSQLSSEAEFKIRVYSIAEKITTPSISSLLSFDGAESDGSVEIGLGLKLGLSGNSRLYLSQTVLSYEADKTKDGTFLVLKKNDTPSINESTPEYLKYYGLDPLGEKLKNYVTQISGTAIEGVTNEKVTVSGTNDGLNVNISSIKTDAQSDIITPVGDIYFIEVTDSSGNEITDFETNEITVSYDISDYTQYENLTLYCYNYQKETYEKADAAMSGTTLTAKINKNGQYVLATGDVKPVISDVVIGEKDGKLVFNANVTLDSTCENAVAVLALFDNTNRLVAIKTQNIDRVTPVSISLDNISFNNYKLMVLNDLETLMPICK